MKLAPVLAFLSLLAFGALAQDPLPQDEAKLFEHAQQSQARGLYVEADRAYRAILEKFPNSDRVREAMQRLAGLHASTSRLEEARRWYRALVEKFPTDSERWEWRMGIARTYEQQGQKEKAIEEYRAVARDSEHSYLRTAALQYYWHLQDKDLGLSVHRTFLPGEEPVVNVRRRNVKDIRFRATQVDYAALLPVLKATESADLSDLVDRVAAGRLNRIKEWTEEYKVDGKPATDEESEVKIPSTRAGVYVLEATHDGMTLRALAVVGRYGLIVKSGAGKLLCFVQDRATTRPVEGATIHVLSPERPFRGSTDAHGLFVTAGFMGGLVVAANEDELAFADSYSRGPEDDDDSDPLIYISTDRPIYRPGHTVHFRIVHRDEIGTSLVFRPGRRLIVRIFDPKGNLLRREVLAANEFGSAEGSFVLGDAPTLGEYSLRVRPEPKDSDGVAEEQPGAWIWHETRGRFRVDEYRKPEFKVAVTYAKTRVLQGEKLRGAIRAEYYFGGAAEGADVQYRVFKARLGYWDWGWPVYYDWYGRETDDEGPTPFFSPGNYGDAVSDGFGQTDREGKLAFSLETPKEEHDVVYTVVATVVDFSRRTVEGVGSCTAGRAEFSIALSLGRVVYRAGERIGVKARAVTSDGKPVPDTKIAMSAAARKWNQKGESNDAVFAEAASVTDVNGFAEFAFTPEIAGGNVVLTAKAKDSRGNATTSETSAWLAGPGDWYTPRDLEGFTLTLDKKTYDLGETAQVLIQSQHKNVTLLFTVEGSEIFHREVVTLQGHSKLLSFKAEDPALAPNAFIQVISVRGDAVLEASRRFVVNPARKYVHIEMKPDREEYRPRQKARFEVRTTGADGKPVAAEVALGLVDDSIYALQDEYEEDIRKFFVKRKWNEVTTSSSLEYRSYGHSKGGPLTGATFALAGDEEKGQGNRLAATEVRSKFADTMLWKVVRTDADGRAAVEVEVPDNLTTWRATARAVTIDSRFGQERRSVVSRKNVIVRLETPRFLTQNDDSTLTAVVHNYLPAEKELRIEFSAAGVEVRGEAVRSVRVPSGGVTRLDWKALARDVGTAKVVVRALGDEDSDAMELSLPILPHGSPRWETKSGSVEGRVVEKVTVPADAVPGTAELRVAVTPVQASMVLEALDSLAGYPYGCVEQTMSRFLPSVVVAGTLRKLGLSRPALERELPFMISSGVQRLYSMQHADGGWGWWQQDETSEWMTAYVVSGLSMAREAGVTISPEAWEPALGRLRAMLGKSEDLNRETYLLYALAAAGELGESEVLWRDYLVQKTEELKPCALSLLALVLHRQNLDARPILRSLARRAKEAGGAATFEGTREHGWLDDGVEAAAAALRAFLAIDPKNPIVPKLVQGLALGRDGTWWRSTRQTAMAVYALTEVLAATGGLHPDMTVSLTLNGKALFSERITRENWAAFNGVRTFAPSELRPGENEIVIEKQGTGSPTYSISLRYHQKGESLAASKGGLRIERTYNQIELREGQRALRPLPDGFTASVGQEIEVTLVFTADQSYEWLMVEDPIPAGFEPVREYWGWWGWEWGYWYDLKEFHDQRVSVAMRQIEPGTHTVSYTMRAEMPGDYHVLPTRAFNMYFPEVGGNSAESRVRVTDRK